MFSNIQQKKFKNVYKSGNPLQKFNKWGVGAYAEPALESIIDYWSRAETRKRREMYQTKQTNNKSSIC